VTTFDWSQLCAAASFDVVMIDPPWQLATANPTRGVALGYSQLTGEQQQQQQEYACIVLGWEV
jgi:mRNA (2'-O-methyladenosine-N6-)-methyltransferase